MRGMSLRQAVLLAALLVCAVWAGLSGAQVTERGWDTETVKSGKTLAVESGGTIDVASGGVVRYLPAVVTYNTTDTARTITAAEAAAGTLFIMASTSDDPATFNLPAAAAGMELTFVDNDATAAADLTINPDDADTIDGGTAGVSYNCTSDAVGQAITLRTMDGINWVPVAVRGTWAAGS